ncbi:hypothetical protein [Streptomyces mashuensis]|uniref:hypothetical protein n=1 Tax=Streptomyces mashuensis TaxID=33904 RepID=UPI001E4DC19A|nr:hypothetical protein [Streptomyces mashuensis]
MPEPRGAHLRMAVLAGAVVLAVALPLAAASAGAAGQAGHEGAPGREGVKPGAGSGAGSGVKSGVKSGAGRGRTGASRPATGGAPGTSSDLLGLDGSPDGLADPSAPPAPSPGAAPADGGRGAAGDRLRSAARCGPELSAPEGVEAQTCVMEQGPDTWGRLYYRNATGTPLTGVLTVMAPDGHTMQVHCPMAATDDPDMCETPRERTAHGHGAYTAVSEVGSAEGKLLLRSGSNSTGPDEG